MTENTRTPYRVESIHLCFTASDQEDALRRFEDLVALVEQHGFFFQGADGPSPMAPADVVAGSPLARAIGGDS